MMLIMVIPGSLPSLPFQSLIPIARLLTDPLETSYPHLRFILVMVMIMLIIVMIMLIMVMMTMRVTMTMKIMVRRQLIADQCHDYYHHHHMMIDHDNHPHYHHEYHHHLQISRLLGHCSQLLPQLGLVPTQRPVFQVLVLLQIISFLKNPFIIIISSSSYQEPYPPIDPFSRFRFS